MLKNSLIFLLLIYSLSACRNSIDIEDKFDSYLYQQTQVNNYELMEDLTPEQEEKFIEEKALLIHIISDYNSSCLSILDKNPDSEECEIIEYNISASWER